MKVKVLKPIHTDFAGSLAKGATVEMPKQWADFYTERGAVELYDTKVEKPKLETKPAKAQPKSTK